MGRVIGVSDVLARCPLVAEGFLMCVRLPELVWKSPQIVLLQLLTDGFEWTGRLSA